MREPGEELSELEFRGLRRGLRTLEPDGAAIVRLDGRELVNFSSNDYLGRAASSQWKDSFSRNLEIHGAGSGASRLVCGTTTPHEELERRLARLKNCEAALAFSSGFAVAVGGIPAVCGRGDVVILDKLCHACLIDGAKLSGATLRVFPHNDVTKLKKHLSWARSRIDESGRILVVTESVFSMDGDRCPLREIVAAKEEAGALLWLDEAHAFGVIGPAGRGLAAEHGLEDGVDFHMGTFSKAVGLSGGYLCGSREWIELMVNRARSFIYSTAPPPALAATIADALDWLSGPEGDAVRENLWDRLERFEPDATSPIVPRILGSNESALAAAAALQERGFLAPAIRYPTVPRGSARLRLTITAAHTPDQIEALKNALEEVGSAL